MVIRQQKGRWSMSQPKPKAILGMSYSEIGIIIVLLCVGCVLVGVIFRTLLTRNFPASASSTQITSPNYKQILEANGFTYVQNDSESNPIYTSSCGCLATVKSSDTMGFGVYYDPNNDCPMQDLGAIISVMYPSEVFDFIMSNFNSVIVQDKTINDIVGNFAVSMDFDRVNYMLILVIRNL